MIHLSTSRSYPPFEKKLYGLIFKCGNCSHMKEMNVNSNGSIDIDCWLCGKIHFQQDKIKSEKCPKHKIKEICENFYYF